MIKFFRKIRQNLLNKNKVGKYLLYAFGEIILVIIGILIALNLNQRSEQKTAEAKIDALFEDVLLELKTDIDQSTHLLYDYQESDSLASLVLANNLKYDDYLVDDNRKLRRLITSSESYKTSQTAYDVLMSNIDVIPKKFSNSIKILNKLQNNIKPDLEEYNAIVKKLVDRNITDLEKNYEWFTAANYGEEDEAVNYFLNDFKYKNKVKRFLGEAIITHRTYIARYRINAIACYKEIAFVLNKPLESIDFIVDEKALKGYAGTYIDNSNPESKVELFYVDELLYLKKETQVNPDRLLNLNSETEFAIVFKRGIVKFSKKSSEEVNTMTIHIGHTPVTYTKTKS